MSHLSIPSFTQQVFIGALDSGNKAVKTSQHLYWHGERNDLSHSEMSADTDNSFEKLRWNKGQRWKRALPWRTKASGSHTLPAVSVETSASQVPCACDAAEPWFPAESSLIHAVCSVTLTSGLPWPTAGGSQELSKVLLCLLRVFMDQLFWLSAARQLFICKHPRGRTAPRGHYGAL